MFLGDCKIADCCLSICTPVNVQANSHAEKSSGRGKCTEICYKDPVLEDRQWSAYIDRSPGEDSYSLVSS